MWVLILTMVFGDAPTITAVPGFANESVCDVAGAQWKRATEAMKRGVSTTSYVCVKPGAA